MGAYDDILNERRPVEAVRERMRTSQRAKIFLPFSALSGYETSLEAARISAEENFKEKPGKEQFDDFWSDGFVCSENKIKR